MVYKKILFVIVFAFCSSLVAQTKNNKWQIGVGASIVKFGEEDAAFIGDQYLFQVPRLNLTAPITENISIDGALSFNTFDIGFITNSAKYFSMDGSVRYRFTNVSESFYPYVFAGGSLVDSERKMTPTLNFGAGATYWFSEGLGINSQLYYKYSLESYESMRSHIQVTIGLVFVIKNLSSGGRSGGSVGGSCYYNQH
ncbi:outer membrane protein with beta-barrel domain [Tenacibaculum adriaticum]|uniref:Outer membrane protein with beta-barrel domain n=1 Tax=Tenacibaculum adriaticum TaxID=413713 RepID=A0A5S5DVA4_9FLAO|nr:outer membrane beta-barrel protein [Tenacibaculum adriaticum]TYP99863.1 outer membrane protein with beta-barrel domain [Tenacibaculum adriaticum]